MAFTRICNMDDFSELYDTIAYNGRARLFASKPAYKNLVGPDLQTTLQNILEDKTSCIFGFFMDDNSIGAYALCGVRPSAADGPKDSANCLFVDEMFVSDAGRIRRAEMELHNFIGKYAAEQGYSFVLTMDALQGDMKKYYQDLDKPPEEPPEEMEEIGNLIEDYNNYWK